MTNVVDVTTNSFPTNSDHAAALATFPVRYARTARFSLGTPRNMALAGSGPTIVFCRSKAPDDSTLCLWSLNIDDGVEHLIVDPADLDAAEADLPPAERARRERARETASGIVAFSIDGEGKRVCFALAGELFIVELATGEISTPKIAGTAFDPRLNPQGTAVAYVDGSALRLLTIDEHGSMVDGELRSDPDPLVSFGRAEFIAAEEMQRSRGYWWSPDGTSLLTTRVDDNPVAEWWIADPAHPERTPNPIRYPAAGTTNASVGLELLTIKQEPVPSAEVTATIDWSEAGRYEYLADVVWQAGHQPLIVRQDRTQRAVSLAEWSLDQTPSETTALHERQTITDDVWVELMPGSPRWCSAGLLTIEDREVARQLVLDGVPISGPDVQVRSILGLVPANPGAESVDGAVIVSAWTHPTEIHLFAVSLGDDGADQPSTRSTVALSDQPGVHGGVMTGSTLVVTTSTPDRPGGRVSVHHLTIDDGEVVLSPSQAVIADHCADPGFAAEPIFTTLGTDRLESALFLPSNHDGRSPLPVLLDPYGGPHAQRVLKAHNPHLVSRWFAEHGYAVLVTDGRGTPGRGPAWEREVRGDLATPVLDDQIAALDALLDQHDFLDASRVGIRGWSFGGYLAALAVLRRPDRFHAGLAGAPVTTWQLYDTHYTERYLGHPDTDPDSYRRSNLWFDGSDGPELERLERPLLIIHGLADDNVVAAHTLRFSTALLATGSPHRVLPLSGVTHMTPQEAVAENLLRLQLSFLDETIGDGMR